MTVAAIPLEEDDSFDDEDTVVEVTAEDLHQAWLNALQVAGYSYEELDEQARAGAFKSAAAHRSWHIVKSLLPWREPPA
jgi:hypothetical protein